MLFRKGNGFFIFFMYIWTQMAAHVRTSDVLNEFEVAFEIKDIDHMSQVLLLAWLSSQNYFSIIN